VHCSKFSSTFFGFLPLSFHASPYLSLPADASDPRSGAWWRKVPSHTIDMTYFILKMFLSLKSTSAVNMINSHHLIKCIHTLCSICGEKVCDILNISCMNFWCQFKQLRYSTTVHSIHLKWHSHCQQVYQTACLIW
jgi:hypothetical protein